MKISAKAAAMACSALLLGGCLDEGGIEHYAPLGTGFAGSGLGWTESKAGTGQYDLTYHHNYGQQADEKIRRRATELCNADGYKGAIINPQFTNEQSLVVASGRANCSNDQKRIAAQTSSDAARNAAELAAVREQQNEVNAAIGLFGGIAGLNGLGSPLASATAIMAQTQSDQLSAREAALSGNNAGQGGAGTGDMGLGACEKRPKCAAAVRSFEGYTDRLLAQRGTVSVHRGGVLAWCGGQAGTATLDTCLVEARAAGDTICVNDIMRAKADAQSMMNEARQTANQSYALAADGWMNSCPK